MNDIEQIIERLKKVNGRCKRATFSLDDVYELEECSRLIMMKAKCLEQCCS